MRFFSTCVAFTLLTCGCYSFRGQTAGAIKTLAIPTFENESTEFGLGESITDEVIRQFQKDGTLRIVSEAQADGILRSRIIRVDDQPYTARSDQTVEEYRFTMSCRIELVNPKTEESSWTMTQSWWAVYPYNGSLENRDAAVKEAVGKMTQDILNKIVGSW